MTDDVAGGLDEPDELQPEQGALALASPQDDWSRTDWEKAAAAVLRKSGMLSDDKPDDAVWAALTRTTYDGIEVPPLGTPDQASSPTRPRPSRVGGWDVRVRAFDGSDVVSELERGATSLWVLAEHVAADALAAFLDGVLLDLAPVVLETPTPAHAEALVALGRLAEAEPMIKALEHNARSFDRPWMLVIGARCRAMLLGAQGELDEAEQTVHAALTLHDRLPMPFERARTQLLLGQLQRRRRLKIAAATIGAALLAFEELGTELWAGRARAELERINVRPRQNGELTPSERRVAELVVTGMTTADVAAQLCVSVKTAEANLTRVYRKFDIHSRAELGRLMGALGQ